MTLILDREMAGRSKNATPKFFPRVVLELPDKGLWGGGGGLEGWFFFLKKCAEL